VLDWFGPSYQGIPQKPVLGQAVLALGNHSLGFVADVSPAAFLLKHAGGQQTWVANWLIGRSNDDQLLLVSEARCLEPYAPIATSPAA
jgi:hypothetical protein